MAHGSKQIWKIPQIQCWATAANIWSSVGFNEESNVNTGSQQHNRFQICMSPEIYQYTVFALSKVKVTKNKDSKLIYCHMYCLPRVFPAFLHTINYWKGFHLLKHWECNIYEYPPCLSAVIICFICNWFYAKMNKFNSCYHWQTWGKGDKVQAFFCYNKHL